VDKKSPSRVERNAHEVKALTPEELVKEFTGFVTSIVLKLRKKLRMNVEKEDLFGYAYRGLLDAHQRFDPNEASSFANYAYYRIRGSVLDGCRKEGWLSRNRSRDEAQRIGALNDYLDNAHSVEMNSPRPTKLNDAINRVDGLVSGAALVLMVQEAELEEILVVDEPQTERRAQQDKQKMLKAGLDELDEVEYEVVIRYYFENESMSEIGEALGHSKSWVSRINSRAIDKMRDVVMQPHYIGPD
jgi:RNA polymerase sigma factor for flagellar operon FliA